MEFRPDARTKGARVRAFNPSLEEHGFQSTHTIVEIVNDDMPFLVESVTIEVNRHGLTLHLIVHPVIAVLRAAAGLLWRLAADTVGKATCESFIHVEVDRITDAAQRQCLEGDTASIASSACTRRSPTALIRPRSRPCGARCPNVVARAGLGSGGHASKALTNILERYPRDELFQIADDLVQTAMGILHLGDRHRFRHSFGAILASASCHASSTRRGELQDGAAPEMTGVDVLIAPAVRVSSMSAKNEQERALQAGYEAARVALPRIRAGAERLRYRFLDQTRTSEAAAQVDLRRGLSGLIHVQL